LPGNPGRFARYVKFFTRYGILGPLESIGPLDALDIKHYGRTVVGLERRRKAIADCSSTLE